MIKEQTIRTRDGWELAVTVFLPGAPFHTLLIVGPAMGRPQSMYAEFARFVREKGVAALTFDYRGTGLSRRVDGEAAASLRDWAVLDLDAVLLAAKNQFPGCALVFLAHGISGQLVGLAPASSFIDHLLFINCALNTRALLSWSGRLRLALYWAAHTLRRLLPGLPLFGDLPWPLVNEWLDWTRRPAGLFDVFPTHNYRQLERPILALAFTDDWLATARATQALMRQFPAASVKMLRLSPAQLGLRRVGHAGFFQLPLLQPLWEWVVQWIGRPEVEHSADFFMDRKIHY